LVTTLGRFADHETVPSELVFGFADADRLYARQLLRHLDSAPHLRIAKRQERLTVNDPIVKLLAELARALDDHAILSPVDRIACTALTEAYAKFGIDVIPIFPDQHAFSASFGSGPALAFQAALLNLPVVVEHALPWAQVLAFRADKEATRKYRDLRLWLRSGVSASTLSEAVDLIAQKVDDYTWAIRKHGLETRLGSFSSVLNWQSAGSAVVAASAAGAAGGPLWAALGGGLVLFSEISAYVVKRNLLARSISRGPHREVALLYDAQKRVEQFLGPQGAD
jgi:hypothetical protein